MPASAIINIPDHCFKVKLSLKDYKVIRWSYGGYPAITIRNIRNHSEYRLDNDLIVEMRDLSAMKYVIWSDEDILNFSINKAAIPHPYEEYV